MNYGSRLALRTGGAVWSFFPVPGSVPGPHGAGGGLQPGFARRGRAVPPPSVKALAVAARRAPSRLLPSYPPDLTFRPAADAAPSPPASGGHSGRASLARPRQTAKGTAKGAAGKGIGTGIPVRGTRLGAEMEREQRKAPCPEPGA